jgi:para-aminobenzoate synthetase component 1
MNADQPFFWMDGVLATGLMEITSDAKRLDQGGFWAVVITFEGIATFAHFAEFRRGVAFPELPLWSPLESTWGSSMGSESYQDYVSEIREEIAGGVVYQVNACRTLSTPAPEISLASLFAEILKSNPAPYATFLRLPDIEIASASPELFLKRSGSFIKTSPIKGTQSLQVVEEFGDKDKSENIMIVDLMRNDFGKICEAGSVRVGELLRVEEHPGIRHLVSDIHGNLREEISWPEIFNAISPPGSVSGAPKSSALKIITTHEPIERGSYCGTLGWVEGQEALLNVAIRTFWREKGTLHFGTGAGITWGSNPRDEWRETELKADRLLSIAGGCDTDGWQFGEGIFETILIEEGRPLLIEQHVARAEASGRSLGIVVPDQKFILNAIEPSLTQTRQRLRLSFGSTFTFSLHDYVESESELRVAVLEGCVEAGIGAHKKFPYRRNLELIQRAAGMGFDEVLLVDADGVVGEGATCNYIFNVDGQWVTPELKSGVLPGIIRGLALENGLAVEATIVSSDLNRVLSMVAISSLRIATSVSYLNEKKLEVGGQNQSLAQKLNDLARSH